jgi:tetratricopeptide (TPR) repeat protein
LLYLSQIDGGEAKVTTKDLDTALKALDEGRLEEATTILEKLLEKEGDNPDLLVYLGIAYVQSEDPKSAVEVLQQADELVEEHCVISLFLGRALKALGRLDEAESELRRAIRLDADVSEAWLDLANIYYSKKEYGTAIEILKEALTEFPMDTSLHGLCASCYHRLGDYSAESKHWITLLGEQPKSFFAIWNCAYSLLIQKRPNEAKEYIDLAGSMKPDDDHYLILESEFSMQNDDYKRAINFLNKVKERDPNCVPVLARLAVIAHRNHSIEECHAHIEKLETEVENNPRKWWALSYVFSRLGWDSQLIDCLLRGTEEDTGAAGPWIQLAKIYSQKEMWEKAYPAWIKSFELRKYVKLNCDGCNHAMRIPYSPRTGFDFDKQRLCQKCKNIIEIHQGLAVE